MNVSQAMPQTYVRPVSPATNAVRPAATPQTSAKAGTVSDLASYLDSVMGKSDLRQWMRAGATPLEVCFAAGKVGWASNSYQNNDLIGVKRALANGEKVLALLPSGWVEVKSVDSNLLGMINSVTFVDSRNGRESKANSADFCRVWGTSTGPGYRNYFLTLRQGGQACPQISSASVAFGESWRAGSGLFMTGVSNGHSKQALAGFGLMTLGLLSSPIGIIGSSLKFLGNLIMGGDTTGEKLARGGLGASIAMAGNALNTLVGNFIVEGGNILLNVTYN